jgi:hypothetical protein
LEEEKGCRDQGSDPEHHLIADCGLRVADFFAIKPQSNDLQ